MTLTTAALERRTKSKIGLHHHGQKMSLKAFEFAEVEDGWFVELARGYLVVSEVPSISHAMVVNAISRFLRQYDVTHEGVIYAILEGMNCKVLIPTRESERHPDFAIYLTAPTEPRNRTAWRTWMPELIIEVVSESSRDRDYTEKREEYWTLGVKEYWIVDPKLKQILVLRRGRSKWLEKKLGPADSCETKLLPGFQMPCKAVFEAAGEDSD